MIYKIQINGENNADYYRIGNYDLDMFDSEYEFEVDIKEKDLEVLESVLERAIADNNSFFNYSISKKLKQNEN